MNRLGGALVIGMGMLGLWLHIEYSGWVLLVGILGFVFL